MHIPVNVGNPGEISLKDFAEEIIKLTGTTQKIVYKPLPVDDPKQRKPDITKAKETAWMGAESEQGKPDLP